MYLHVNRSIHEVFEGEHVWAGSYGNMVLRKVLQVVKVDDPATGVVTTQITDQRGVQWVQIGGCDVIGGGVEQEVVYRVHELPLHRRRVLEARRAF